MHRALVSASRIRGGSRCFLFIPAALGECSHCRLARRGITVHRRAILVESFSAGRRICHLRKTPNENCDPYIEAPRGGERQCAHALALLRARRERPNQAAPAMYPALRSLPSCAPINRDHARKHERKSEFCFEVGNEARNPRRRGHVPIKCGGVACAQKAKKPNHKPDYVNSPSDTFRFCHPT
jgi:hypothetical protein